MQDLIAITEAADCLLKLQEKTLARLDKVDMAVSKGGEYLLGPSPAGYQYQHSPREYEDRHLQLFKHNIKAWKDKRPS